VRSLEGVFIDAVWAHLCMFAVGQVFAWRYARSGRFGLGAASTVSLWVTVDAWLVARYLLDLPADAQLAPLGLLYAVALLTVTSFLWACVRRLRGRRTRAARHRAAVAHLLAGAGAAAIAAYRDLTRSDAWDAAAWIGLGDAERRWGQPRRAARCYRRARCVDVASRFRDVLEHRERLLASAKGASGAVLGRVPQRSEPRGSSRRKAVAAS